MFDPEPLIKPNSKNRQIAVRFKQEEMEVIEDRAAELGYDRSNFVKLCVKEHFERLETP